jgi:hypothetical protein
LSDNLQISHNSYKLLITGKSGTGKTTYWLRAMLGLPARLKFVFDHKCEVAQRLGCRPAYNVKELSEMLARGWCIFDPSYMFKGRRPDAFLFFCEFAFEVSCQCQGRKLFCCDELQQFIGTMAMPPEFSAVIEDGRIHGLDALMISSQPNLIHNRVRNQLTEIVSFQQLDQNAIQWLENQAGFDPEQVKTLEKGEFICRNLDSGVQVGGRVF